ncbi:unnamed protein product [Paramecium sonneborni]|uniref:Papain family cysteine protease n=1 Tax=Paramecium sonneborni TaxID=65129 RepID=A0A8S1P9R8_9CILI|nr:unnamed protein product [Paramecium sonneborni]
MEKSLISIGLLLIIGAGLYLRNNGWEVDEIEKVNVFNDWKMRYNKKFSSEQEEMYRYQVFNKNLDLIESHNNDKSGKYTYTLEANQFADLSEQEFIERYLNLKAKIKNISKSYDYIPNGQARDWVEEGKVPPIKDQGTQCGSSWAFSAVGVLEINGNINFGLQTSLSEQDLLDCSGPYGNYGCSGGWMDSGFEYVIDHGIASASDYPYQGKDQTCKTSVKRDFKYVTGFRDVDGCQELQTLILDQSISIGVDATNWSFYKEGILNNCKQNLTSASILVGIDQNGVWKVRHQWGSKWGENGYIRLAPGNTCGICAAASYPILQKI